MKHIRSYQTHPDRLWLTFGEEGGTHGTYAMKTVIRSAIRATLDHEDYHLETAISVTLCDGDYIRDVNARFRQKDTATDVLSFPQFERGEPIYADVPPVLLGDIVLNLDRAEEQAKELGHSFLHEIAFLCIHSTLHLLGYDHELSPEDEEDMCARQREIIKTLPL